MIVKINKPITAKKIEEAEKLLRKQNKGLDAKKFSGTINWGKDAVALQKEWRNEWD